MDSSLSAIVTGMSWWFALLTTLALAAILLGIIIIIRNKGCDGLP